MCGVNVNISKVKIGAICIDRIDLAQLSGYVVHKNINIIPILLKVYSKLLLNDKIDSR